MTWSTFAGSTIYVDANVFIYAIEGRNRFTDLLRAFFTATEDGALSVVTSEITLVEVMTKPQLVGAVELVEAYRQVFADDGVVKLAAVSRAVIDRAIGAGGAVRLKTIDAIHLATAQLAGCGVLLSNDINLVRACRQPMRGVLLGDLVDA